jgi:hypothetical protein
VYPVEIAAERDLTVNGVASGDLSGVSLAVGDLNGDGKDDLVIGAYQFDRPAEAGVVYVVFGAVGSGTLELSTGADIIISGVDPGDLAGYEVGVGDLNNDGFQDLVVGAANADPGGRSAAGEVYVLFGPLAAGTVNLATDADIKVNGVDAGDQAGVGVLSLDLDQDGAQDLVIGAQNADPGGRSRAGETYVMFGPLGAGTLELSTDADLIINGIDPLDFSGIGLGGGDLNQDGFKDLVIGASNAGPGGRFEAGETYVLFGPLGAGVVELSSEADITFNGIAAQDASGSDVTVGDVNEDGADDVLIGATLAAPGGRSRAGETYVLYGPFGAGTYELSARANETLNGVSADDRAGRGIAVGDVNGDQTNDIIVGAQYADPIGRPDAGQAYVLTGARTVAIDVKPNSEPNCFNINGQGVVPVAILGDADFDVVDIDPESLLFDGFAVRVRGKRGPLCSSEDVNGDSYLDLVCQFEDDPTSWTGGASSATLTGKVVDGGSFEGSDDICVVP